MEFRRISGASRLGPVRLAALVLFTGMAAFTCQGSAPKSVGHSTVTDPTFLDQLRAEFQRTNPRIVKVTIIEVRAWDIFGPRAVVATGIRSDMNFSGDFTDELFGIFLANDSLTQVTKVIDKFRTPSWLDYNIRIESLSSDSIIVAGEGATYRDLPMRKAYKR
jgi:hypothetical protein